MTVDSTTRREIERKAKLFADKGKRITRRIVEEIDALIKRLEETKNELVEEVEFEFSNNDYAGLLERIDSKSCPTDDEIKSILSKEIPSDFGPSVDAFNSLRKEIDSLKLWNDEKREATRLNPFDLIPKNLRTISTTRDSISLCWDKVDCDCYYEVELKTYSSGSIESSLKPEFTFCNLFSMTRYQIRVRTVVPGKDVKCIWSDPITVVTELDFKTFCVWKECPDYYQTKYFACSNNSRTVTKTYDDNYCSITGSISLPLEKVISWDIKILKSINNGAAICIGVVPLNEIQKFGDHGDISEKCGWHFACYGSSLYSGPPHNYRKKEYGPRKKDGEYVNTGDTIGVVMDTKKGELSFVLNEVNLGIAYEGIPLDKPLVPCVILKFEGDSVELII